MTDSTHVDGLAHGGTDDGDGLGESSRSGSLSSVLQRNATSLEADTIARSKMFDLGQLEIIWEAEIGTLWAYVTPNDRPNYNMPLLREAMIWQNETRRLFGAAGSALRFMVLGSRFPGIWNLGGDLELFADCIVRRDEAKLRNYGRRCIEILDRLWRSSDLPVINIGLVQGDALGGGLEALLCHDVIIAEKQARFGLPEVLFGLFPGMGAYSILARKLGHAQAERMILSGKIYSAEELHEMGLVTLLVEEGEGEEAARAHIADNISHHAGQLGVYRAGRRVNPLEMDELIDIVDGWVEAALQLTDRHIRLMRRLANAQSRLHAR